MGDENYDKILDRISRSANIDKGEIERKVEAKRAKLSGLISREGAAQVIAAELGLKLDDQKLKINELLPSMRKVNVIGKVIRLQPVRTFMRKGSENKVANFVIADDSSNIKVVLWDVNHIELIEKGEIKEDSVVEIAGGSMRDNEIHLGSFSELKPSKEVIESVNTEKSVRGKNIVDFKPNDNASVRAFILQAFDPKFFHVCPECKKKAVQEGGEGEFTCNGEHGKVVPEKRALMNIVIDDGTESIRSVLFHEALGKMGLSELDNSDKLIEQKKNLLGKEMVFSGTVRMNKFFNTPEFSIDDMKAVDVDALIVELEK